MPKPADPKPVHVSEDLNYVLVAGEMDDGLKLVNTQTGETDTVCDQANSALYATISPDGQYVCYKGFEKGGDGILQVPMLYHIEAKVSIPLSEPVEFAGTPAVSGQGRVAYTVGNTLVILRPDLSLLRTIDLGYYVNLVAFSPDGSKAAFSDRNEQIVVMDIARGKRTTVTDGKASYWRPSFSPRGDKVLASSVDGRIAVGPANRRGLVFVETGESPTWLDNNRVSFVKKTIRNQVVEKTELMALDTVKRQGTTLLSLPGDNHHALARGNMAVGAKGAIKYGYIRNDRPQLIDLSSAKPLIFKPEKTAPVEFGGGSAARAKVDYGSYVQLEGVPYLHQLNDTPDYWNGNSSCNASSAIMAINYYSIMARRAITCSWPSSHTSYYGWYVPEVYSFNGRTYNIGSRDPAGRTGYGGFGYITQANWADTKTRMSEYISYHGPTAGVDWSPTMAKARSEINANHPFVLLTSITSSGHYICTIGYYKSQSTLIFNDPYGNKNVAYPSSNGVNARYDWPGYNNGYKNLNTVHCYIWCRFPYVVFGAIKAKYDALGGAMGVLGFATTNEMVCPDNVGRYNHFRNGSIYWTQSTGAWSVRGAIRDRWAALGWEGGVCGYPMTDENVCPDNVGRYNHFTGKGMPVSIYWTPSTGAWQVGGAIRAKWAALGWEGSALGYPKSDEYAVPEGRRNDFQNGRIVWVASTGQCVVTLNSTTPVADVIIDNTNAGFTVTGSWSTGTSASDKYGTDYRYHATGTSADQAAFTFTAEQTRDYDIYAWWCKGTNRSNAAPFILPDGATVKTNQQANGGMWNLLGTKNLTAGSKTVKLGCNATTGFIVVADAVKVVAR